MQSKHKNFCGLRVMMCRPEYTEDAQVHKVFHYFCVILTKTEMALECFHKILQLLIDEMWCGFCWVMWMQMERM